MSGIGRPTDLATVAAQIQELRESVRDLQHSRLRIPVLSQDPPDSDLNNIWLLHDGRLRTRKRNSAGTAWVIDEWVRTTPGSSTSATAPPSPGSAPTSRQTAYPAVWSRSYQAGGNARTDAGVTMLYYGYSDAVNGRNRSYIGFDHTTIAADLVGSTVGEVWLTITNIFAGVDTGSDMALGIHNVSGGSAPGTWQGVVASSLDVERFRGPESRTVQLPLEFATYIRDGLGKGIAIEAPDDNPSHYGYAAGVGSGYAVPVLTIVYAK